MKINDIVSNINAVLFDNAVVYVLLAVGILFTIWSVFGQYRAITHGVGVVRGKFDEHDDPGAVNHFQALSTALSATVGLGNIAGVALAVGLGGPGAIFWMWIIGILGMALKMTEVTQSMLYRNTDDPENPHGGPMFVAEKGLAENPGLRPVATALFFLTSVGAAVLGYTIFDTFLAAIPGAILAIAFLVLGTLNGKALGSMIGGVFVITLLASTLTGGNMFQAWNVCDITNTYFDIPQPVTGGILTVFVGIVIIGGIKRIGAVTGRIVPLMCVLYFLTGLGVLIVNIGAVPDMLMLIIKSGLPPFLGGESANPTGAFLGGAFGFAALLGVKRALFSSEAGQGSAPIAHAAAKTDEPVREGVVAGLEPMIDTLIVCTLTALVILSTGTYNRPPESRFTSPDDIRIVAVDADANGEQDVNESGKLLWTLDTPLLRPKTQEARRILQTPEGQSGWKANENIFMILRGDDDPNQDSDLIKVEGIVTQAETLDDLDATTAWQANWKTFASNTTPAIAVRAANNEQDLGIYVDYAGASLTAHAFDREFPGLGKWLVSISAWLFALSTVISWSYYGEQGVYYLAGPFSEQAKKKIIFGYKIVYCLLVFATAMLATPLITGSSGTKQAIIATDTDLDTWTTLGLGVMLWANIPLMLVFAPKAMKAYHDYMGKLKRGEFHAHEAPEITEVVEGKDVEDE